MALEKLSPSGAPILPRMNYGEETGGTERIILVDASGKPQVVEASAAAILAKLDVALSTRALESGGNLASVKTNTDKLDINLSRAALQANVAQHLVQANYGYTYGFMNGGTAIPAATTNTPLSISGFGKISFVISHLEDETYIFTFVTLDGTEVLGYCGNPTALRYVRDPPTDLLQAGIAKVVSWTTNKIGVEYSIGLLGSFGTGASVTVQNTHAGDTKKAHVRINYFTGASEKFVVNNPVVKDVAVVRKDLARTLSLDEEAITAIYQENWDDVQKINVPSLSTIIHSQLSAAGKTEVARFLSDRRAV